VQTTLHIYKKSKLETVSIVEPMQTWQHAQNPLMLSTLGERERRKEGEVGK